MSSVYSSVVEDQIKKTIANSDTQKEVISLYREASLVPSPTPAANPAASKEPSMDADVHQLKLSELSPEEIEWLCVRQLQAQILSQINDIQKSSSSRTLTETEIALILPPSLIP